MDYRNAQGVRFKVYSTGQDRYVVKYYPGVSQWPRTLRHFQCPTDETRQEMFFLLGNMRLCGTCQVTLLGHLDDPGRGSCQDCILKAAAAAGVRGEDIPECPVCYQKMLTIDGTRKSLACKHEVCAACAKRLSKPTTDYDPTYGIMWSIRCPMCRDVSTYDSAFRTSRANARM